MMVEFEKRLAYLNREIHELEAAGKGQSEECQKLRGALDEAERLFGFYKNQQAEKKGEMIHDAYRTDSGNAT